MIEKRKKKNKVALKRKYGFMVKHAVLSSLENPQRTIKNLYLLETEEELIAWVEKYKKKSNKKFFLRLVDRNFIRKTFQ